MRRTNGVNKVSPIKIEDDSSHDGGTTVELLVEEIIDLQEELKRSQEENAKLHRKLDSFESKERFQQISKKDEVSLLHEAARLLSSLEADRTFLESRYNDVKKELEAFKAETSRCGEDDDVDVLKAREEEEAEAVGEEEEDSNASGSRERGLTPSPLLEEVDNSPVGSVRNLESAEILSSISETVELFVKSDWDESSLQFENIQLLSKLHEAESVIRGLQEDNSRLSMQLVYAGKFPASSTPSKPYKFSSNLSSTPMKHSTSTSTISTTASTTKKELHLGAHQGSFSVTPRSLKKQVAAFEEEVADCRRQLSEKTQQNQFLQKTLQLEIEKALQWQEEKKDLEFLVEELRQKVEETTKQSDETIQCYAAELAELKAKAVGCGETKPGDDDTDSPFGPVSDNDRLQQVLYSTEIRLKETQDELEESQVRLSQMVSENASCSEELHRLKGDLGRNNERVLMLEVELGNAMEENDRLATEVLKIGEAEKYQNELQNLQREMETLQSENEKLKRESSRNVAVENMETSTSIEVCQKELIRLKIENGCLAEEKQQLAEDTFSLTEKLNSANQKIEQLMEELEVHRQRSHARTLQSVESRGQDDRLHLLAEERNSARKEIEILTEEVRELKKKLLLAERRRDSLSQRCEDVELEQTRLTRDLEVNRQRYELAQTENSKLEAMVEIANNAVDHLTIHNNELETRIANQQQNLNQLYSQLSEAEDGLKSKCKQYQDLSEDHASVSCNLSEARSNLDSVTSSFALKCQEIEDNHSNATRALEERFSAKLKELEEKLIDSQLQLKQREVEHRHVVGEYLERLAVAEVRYQTAASSLLEIELQLSRAQQANLETDEKIRVWKDAAEQLEKSCLALSSEVAKLKEQIACNDSSSPEIATALAAEIERRDVVEKQLMQVTLQLTAVEIEKDAAMAQHEATRERLSAEEINLQSQVSFTSTLREQLHAEKASHKLTKEALATAEGRLALAAKEVEDVRGNLSETQTLLNDATAEVNSLRSQVAVLEQKLRVNEHHHGVHQRSRIEVIPADRKDIASPKGLQPSTELNNISKVNNVILPVIVAGASSEIESLQDHPAGAMLSVNHSNSEDGNETQDALVKELIAAKLSNATLSEELDQLQLKYHDVLKQLAVKIDSPSLAYAEVEEEDSSKPWPNVRNRGISAVLENLQHGLFGNS